jgi:hypothetical protein
MKAVINLGMRGALLAMFVAVVLAGATNPATANAARFAIVSVEDPNLCLAANFEGTAARLDRCDVHNPREKWEIWNEPAGWTRNVATGRCLRATSTIYLAACSQTDRYEYWTYWQRGWYQRVGHPTIGAPKCLSRLVGQAAAVTLVPCVNPTGWHHPRERWSVAIWAQ